MKKTTRIICITLCVLLIALSAAGVIWALYSKFAKNVAHAEYEDLAGTETIVNFNQIYDFDNAFVDNNGAGAIFHRVNNYYTLSGTNSSTAWINTGLNSYNFISGHKYYFYINTNDELASLNMENNGSGVFTQNHNLIWSVQSNYNNIVVYIRYGAGNHDNKYIQFYAIDLTQMFGAGNEPNLEQAQEYFTADYYNYTKGTPIYYSNTAAYSQGYSKAIQDYTNYYQINLLNYSAFSSAFVENTINNSNAFVEKYIDYEIVDYPFLKARGYLFVPFSSIAKSGSQLSFNYVDPGQGGSGDYLWCGIYYENSFIPIMYIGDLTGQKIEFITPFDTSYLVFCNSSTRDYFTFVDAAYWIGELQVSNAYLNMEEIINAAIRGYDYEIRTYYTKGYEGYETIFAEGRLAGQADTNATIGAMEYIGAAFTGIGSILQIELLPNVPFSIFILLPLMFALIAFVVKLSKGGD